MAKGLNERLLVEIEPDTLRRLMAEGQLAAVDFRCVQSGDKQRVKRWCLEHLGLRLRRQ